MKVMPWYKRELYYAFKFYWLLGWIGIAAVWFVVRRLCLYVCITIRAFQGIP